MRSKYTTWTGLLAAAAVVVAAFWIDGYNLSNAQAPADQDVPGEQLANLPEGLC